MLAERRKHNPTEAEPAVPRTAARRAGGTTRSRRLSFVMFLAAGAVLVFFLGFNWSIPFLKDGGVDHALLNRLSRLGAILYPIAVLLTGIAYAGIVLTPRRGQPASCSACGSTRFHVLTSCCPDCETRMAQPDESTWSARPIHPLEPTRHAPYRAAGVPRDRADVEPAARG